MPKTAVTSVFALFATLLLGASAQAQEAVWVDADAGCGIGRTVDVDDCWALAYALRAEGLSVRGIGTVFGNASEPEAFAAVTEALRVMAPAGAVAPAVHRGAARALHGDRPEATAASAALLTALAREPLTIIALGPVTNIATVLARRPDLGARVKRIVAVAGRRPGASSRFFVGASPLHLHDVNFRHDVAAFDVLLRADVAVVLVPFEAAAQVTVSPGDLVRISRGGQLGRWLAETSRGWLEFWQRGLGAPGFHPFDLLAVAYVAHPAAFECQPAAASIVRRRARLRVSRDDLVATLAPRGRWNYCSDVKSTLKDDILGKLAGAA